MSYLVVDGYAGGSFVKVIPEENKIIGYVTNNHGGVPDNFKNWFVVVSDSIREGGDNRRRQGDRKDGNIC